MIANFINKYKLLGMVTRRSLFDYPSHIDLTHIFVKILTLYILE